RAPGATAEAPRSPADPATAACRPQADGGVARLPPLWCAISAFSWAELAKVCCLAFPWISSFRVLACTSPRESPWHRIRFARAADFSPSHQPWIVQGGIAMILTVSAGEAIHFGTTSLTVVAVEEDQVHFALEARPGEEANEASVAEEADFR